jgi:transposase InsO family protein
MVTERQINNAVLGKRIEEIFNAHRRRYGAVRIRNELKKENTKVSIKRVNRLMKSRNLVSLHKQPFKVVTTNSKHNLAISENTLNREFSPTKPNEVWAADITYLKTVTGCDYHSCCYGPLHSKDSWISSKY